MIRFCLPFLLLFLPELALAADAGDSVNLGLFDVPDSDRSLMYLKMIFGNVGQILLAGDLHNPLLGQLFLAFNTSVFVVGVFYISIIAFTSIIRMGAEGSFMGKNVSQMWAPVRVMLGLFILMPTTSGYSFIQVGVMWFVINGIGAGNAVWNVMLDNTYHQHELETSGAQLDSELLKHVFKMAACQEFFNSGAVDFFGTRPSYLQSSGISLETKGSQLSMMGMTEDGNTFHLCGGLRMPEVDKAALDTLITKIYEASENPDPSDEVKEQFAKDYQAAITQTNSIAYRQMFQALYATAYESMHSREEDWQAVNGLYDARLLLLNNLNDALRFSYLDPNDFAPFAPKTMIARANNAPSIQTVSSSHREWDWLHPSYAAQEMPIALEHATWHGSLPSLEHLGQSEHTASFRLTQSVQDLIKAEAETESVLKAEADALAEVEAAAAAEAKKEAEKEAKEKADKQAEKQAEQDKNDAITARQERKALAKTLSNAEALAEELAENDEESAESALANALVEALAVAATKTDTEDEEEAEAAEKNKKEALDLAEQLANELTVALAETDYADEASELADDLTEEKVKYTGLDKVWVGVVKAGEAFDDLGGALEDLFAGLPDPYNLGNRQNDGKADGWIHAGSYYFTLMNQTQTTNSTLFEPPTVIPLELEYFQAVLGKPNGTAAFDYFNKKTDDYFKSFAEFIEVKKAAEASAEEGLSLEANISKRGIKGWIPIPDITPYVFKLINAMTDISPDPIYSLSTVGIVIMQNIEALWMTSVAVVVGIMLISAFGSCTTGFAHAMAGIVEIATGILNVVIVLVWAPAAFAGIYLPMIPYLVFTVTAIGWMILVIEAMAAGPLIAIGFLIPGQEEFGKAGHAIVLLTNLFMRPMLMVIGFAAGTELARISLRILAYSFQATFSAQVGPSTIFASIALFYVYLGIVLTLVNESFTLIHVLPDKTMRWIGMSPESSSAERLMRSMKGHADKASQTSGEVAKGATQMVGKKASEQKGG